MKKRVILLLIFMLIISSFSFADAQPSDWAVEFVDDVKEQNLIEETFFNDYQSSISRKDFAYLGVKLYEEYTGESALPGEASFADTTDEWILKAKNVGIVGGYPDGTYGPNNNITREELAVLFVNVFKASNIEYLQPGEEKFVDDSTIADWAKESVYIAKANGVINGVGNNTFDPSNTATKEQSLIMFNKIQVSNSYVSGKVAKKILKEVSDEMPKLTDLELELNSVIEFSNDAIVNVGGEGYLILDSKLPKELKGAKFSADFESEFLLSINSFKELPECFFHNIEDRRKSIGFQITTLVKKDTYILLTDENNKLIGYTFFEGGLEESDNIYKVELYYTPDGIDYIPTLDRYKDFNVYVDFESGSRNASANSVVGETYNGNGFKSILYPVYSPYGKNGISVKTISEQHIRFEKMRVLPYELVD